MCIEHTLSIIKPDVVSRNIVGSVISRFETAGLVIIKAKMLHLTIKQASEFYSEHCNKNFFNSLIDFMISGPVFVQILSGQFSVRKNREIMGATNPIYALSGTIRSDYGYDCTRNAVHGSDSKESAKREIFYFFKV